MKRTLRTAALLTVLTLVGCGGSEVTGPYANCDAARADGADPVYEGDPGFGPHLDRDGDGIGCEPYTP